MPGTQEVAAVSQVLRLHPSWSWAGCLVASPRVNLSSWSCTNAYYEHGKRHDGWGTGRGHGMILGSLSFSTSPDGASHFKGRWAPHPLCTENYHPQAPCWNRTKTFLGDSGSGGAQQLQPYPLMMLSAFPRVLQSLDLLPQRGWRVHPAQTVTGSKSTRAAPLPLEMGTDWVHDSKIYCSVTAEKEHWERNLWPNILICLFLLFRCRVL